MVNDSSGIEILTHRKILFRWHRRRSREKVVFEHGEQATQFAEVLEALSSFADQPRPLSVPRRVFVSYRWGDAKTEAWVRRLVDELTLRGNIVLFDKEIATRQGPMPVASLVGLLATCHYFIFVVDPDYLERIESPFVGGRQHGWASTEYRIAKSVGEALRMPLVGLLREGNRVPKGCRLITEDSAGSVFDVRTESQLTAVLDASFVSKGSISEAQSSEVSRLVFESEAAMESRHLAQSFSLAERAVTLAPMAPETNQQFVIVALCLNRLSEAAKTAAEMIELDSARFALRYMAGLALALAGRAAEAINILQPMLHVEPANWRLNTALAVAWTRYGFGGNAEDYWYQACADFPPLEKLVARWAKHKKSAVWIDSPNDQPSNTEFPLVDFSIGSQVVLIREIQGNTLINTYIQIGPDVPGRRGRELLDQVLLSRATPFVCNL